MTKEEILEIRKLYGMTQKEWADKLNTTIQTISNWESGRAKPMGTVINHLKMLKSEIQRSGGNKLHFYNEGKIE